MALRPETFLFPSFLVPLCDPATSPCNYLDNETLETAKFQPIFLNDLEAVGIVLESQTFSRPGSYLKTAYLFKVQHGDTERKRTPKANGEHEIGERKIPLASKKGPKIITIHSVVS